MKIILNFIKRRYFFLLLSIISLTAVPFVYVNFLLERISSFGITLFSNPGFTNSFILNKLSIIFIFYLILQLLHFFGIKFLSYFLSYIYTDIKTYSFSFAQKLPLEILSKKNDGEIEKSISNVSENFTQTIEIFIFIIFHNILSSLFLLYKIFKSNIKLGIISFFWIFTFFISSFFVAKYFSKKTENLIEIRSQQSGFITDIFKNILLTKVFRCQKLNMEKFKEYQDKDRFEYQNTISSLANFKFLLASINILFFCLFLFTFFRVDDNLLNNKELIINVCAFGLKITESLWILLSNLIPFFTIFGKFKKSLSFFKNPLEDLSGSISPIFVDNIKVKNLSYQLNENRILFKDLSFDLKKEFVLIKGSSGSGKSILMKMLLGLIKHKDNTIFIDSHDINNIDKNIYLKRISFLPKSDQVFNQSILYNLKVGKHDADEEEINKVIKIVNLEKEINLFQDKLEKQCGNSGNNLSGGQIKRIALARMLLHDNDGNIIIMDEPFNNLDQETTNIIMDYLSSLKGKRKVICVDHSDIFIKIADKIIEIN